MVAIAAAYVLGAIVPLSVIARWGRRVTRAIGGRRSEHLRQAFGVAMAASALVVLSGLDIPLQTRITQALPAELGSALVSVEQQPAVRGAQRDRWQRRSGRTRSARGPRPGAETTGITAWINSPPTTLKEEDRGKVVLVEFWTFGCINCIHVQPYVKAWYEHYAADGFVVLGVHTPELSFERDLDNVRDAVAKADVRFPVAFDPDYATWRAFGNRYWAVFYFVDKAGQIRHEHFGEGDYDGSEAVIQALLAEPGPD